MTQEEERSETKKYLEERGLPLLPDWLIRQFLDFLFRMGKQETAKVIDEPEKEVWLDPPDPAFPSKMEITDFCDAHGLSIHVGRYYHASEVSPLGAGNRYYADFGFYSFMRPAETTASENLCRPCGAGATEEDAVKELARVISGMEICTYDDSDKPLPEPIKIPRLKHTKGGNHK